MHHIQQKILAALLYAEHLGYAQMRPKGIESNHFSYHLEQLVKNKLIIKNDKQYSLAPAGLKLVDRLSQQKMTDRLQPHIVTAIDLTNKAGETLVYKRHFQPYINRFCHPLGKLHYEEFVAEAAARELQEKTGLTNVPLTHKGVIYLESRINGETISKVMYHIFQGTTNEQPLQTNPDRGEASWTDHLKIDKTQAMPGFFAIKKLLATSPDSFFYSEVCEEMS